MNDFTVTDNTQPHFTHVDLSVELKDYKTENRDGSRYYLIENDISYPSITTVLSDRKKEGLIAWRKKVGNDVANHISRTSAARGTSIHEMCEKHLNNEPVLKDDHKFFPYTLFCELRKTINIRVNNIHAQESALYSHKYKVAGRVDCVAEYDGKLSIIDFKSSRSRRTNSYNENYYIQASAYAEMWEEMTGQEIEQIVILVITEDGEVQEFIKEKYDYLPLLEQAVEDFNQTHDSTNRESTSTLSEVCEQ